MKHFTSDELETIRQISIALYVDADPGNREFSQFRFETIVEATYLFLKRTERLKNED
jgi:hypothetical protein